jgi:hypothetical protein
VGTYERYLDITPARNYHPLSLNPVLRSYFFANDILTLGMELNANLESFPETDSSAHITPVYNGRVRFIPYHYLIVHPNMIIREEATFGFSRNSLQVKYENYLLYNDYDIVRYGSTLILLCPYQIKLYCSPYFYQNRYGELPARSKDGSFNLDNPRLKERGKGIALGLRQHSFRWGIPELAFEYLSNRDIIFGANDYLQWKVVLGWENQYFSKRFGYNMRMERSQYDAKRSAIGLNQVTRTYGSLAQVEYFADAVLVINWNRNISLRPEYDCVYQLVSQKNTFFKSRYWLNIHLLL